MIWFKKNKINTLKKNLSELKDVSITGNDIKCTVDDGVIDVSDDRLLDGFWCSQFLSSNGKIITIPETSKSLVNAVRKSLYERKDHAGYGYIPVSERNRETVACHN